MHVGSDWFCIIRQYSCTVYVEMVCTTERSSHAERVRVNQESTSYSLDL